MAQETKIDVKLVKNYDDKTPEAARQTIVNSIIFCHTETEITCKNLKEYVLNKNGWKGIVIESCSHASWTGGYQWVIEYKINGTNYMFVCWSK